MIGQTLSHYRILDKLGGGGMGVERRGQRDKAQAYHRRFLQYWSDGDLDRDKVADAQKKLASGS